MLNTRKFPPPQFEIGQIVKYRDEGSDAFLVTGLRLIYFNHSRQYIWEYKLSDRVSTVRAWVSADEIVAPDTLSDDEMWHIQGVLPSARECWQCAKVRVDDMEDCPLCGADCTPF